MAQVIEILLGLLNGQRFLKLPWLRVSLIVIIAVLTGLKSIVDSISTIADAYGDLQELAEFFEGLCGLVAEAGGATVGNVKDLIDKIKEVN